MISIALNIWRISRHFPAERRKSRLEMVEWVADWIRGMDAELIRMASVKDENAHVSGKWKRFERKRDERLAPISVLDEFRALF